MREKVLMAKHVSQDPRFRRGGGLAKAKAKGKAKAASKSAVSSLAKKKFHQTVVRGSDAASSVLNETLSEALENIVSTLVSNPDRILLMQKFVRNEKLFTSAKVSTKEGYLHNTLLVMSQSPKKLWKDSLVAASEKYHDKRKCWTATLLTACDKAEGLQGVEQMLVALADIDMTDKIPVRHREVFVGSIARRIIERGRPWPTIKRDGKIDWERCVCFQLAGLVDNQHTKLKHWSGKEADIPQDYMVLNNGSWSLVNNHSSMLAELRGKRASPNCWEIFEECLGDSWDFGLYRDEELFKVAREVAKDLGISESLMQGPTEGEEAWDIADSEFVVAPLGNGAPKM